MVYGRDFNKKKKEREKRPVMKISLRKNPMGSGRATNFIQPSALLLCFLQNWRYFLLDAAMLSHN